MLPFAIAAHSRLPLISVYSNRIQLVFRRPVVWRSAEPPPPASPSATWPPDASWPPGPSGTASPSPEAGTCSSKALSGPRSANRAVMLPSWDFTARIELYADISSRSCPRSVGACGLRVRLICCQAIVDSTWDNACTLAGESGWLLPEPDGKSPATPSWPTPSPTKPQTTRSRTRITRRRIQQHCPEREGSIIAPLQLTLKRQIYLSICRLREKT
jgi:hypothetical protein